MDEARQVAAAMSCSRGFPSPYSFFAREQLPKLQQSGLPVACVADAIPHCAKDWAVRARGLG